MSLTDFTTSMVMPVTEHQHESAAADAFQLNRLRVQMTAMTMGLECCLKTFAKVSIAQLKLVLAHSMLMSHTYCLRA